MADCNRIDELRNILLSRGYTRKYVDRLVGELKEHRSSILANGREDEETAANRGLDERLGLNSEFLSFLEYYPELKPWSRRHPIISFVLIPGIALCLLSIGSVLSGELIRQLGDREQLNLGIQLSFWHAPVFSLLFSFVTAWLVAKAVKLRIHWFYPLMTMSVIAAGSMFVTEIGFCRKSGNAVSYSHFGFDVWKAVGPFVICLVGLSIASARNWKVARMPSSWSSIESNRSFGTRMLGQVFSSVVLGAGFVALFLFSSNFAYQNSKPHAVDKLIAKRLSHLSRARDSIELFTTSAVQKSLAFNPECRKTIREKVADLDSFIRLQQSQYSLKQHESYSEYYVFERKTLAPEICRTEAALLKLLTADQRKRFGLLQNAKLDSYLVFEPKVRRKAGITSRQNRELKNLLREKIRKDSKWETKLIKGVPGAEEELSALANWYQREVRQILSKKQHRIVEQNRSPNLQ